jgi:hypothetical protein
MTLVQLLALGATLFSGEAAAQSESPADTLTLAEAYAEASVRNPMLRAERSRADAIAAMRRSTGLPTDPQVQIAS